MAHISLGLLVAPIELQLRVLNNLLRRSEVGDDGMTDLEREVMADRAEAEMQPPGHSRRQVEERLHKTPPPPSRGRTARSRARGPAAGTTVETPAARTAETV